MQTLSTLEETAPALVRREIAEAIGRGAPMLPEPVGKKILRAYGIVVPRGEHVRGIADLAAAAQAVPGPWVLKAVSSTLIHKSDAGAVRLGITDAAALEAIAAEMTAGLSGHGHAVDGFLLEEMAPAGVEVIVGAVRRPGIGWVLMVGIGGIFVEVLDDVSLRVAPVDHRDVVAMLEELRGNAMLHGMRGQRPADIDALVDLVLALAGPRGLLDDLPAAVTEVEFNPVFAGSEFAIAVDARFILDASSAAQDSTPDAAEAELADMTALFAPRTVAVYGASTRKANSANLFIRNLQEFGFDGTIVPVHPTAARVEGLPAVGDAGLIPEVVDYAYVAVPADGVPQTVADMGGRVRFAQVVSSGFGETADGAARDERLREALARTSVRLLGPNCIGTHSTRGHLTFLDDADRTCDGVSLASQSGGLTIDILRQGAARGVGFNKAVSLGNSLDLGAGDMVSHYLADDDTRVIALYLESVAEGAEVLRAVRRSRRRKPLVLLAGGRTDAGAQAASSHTGALVDDHRLWQAVAAQSGAILVNTVEELLDAVVALAERDDDTVVDTDGVVLFGNGGGSSVLASDALDRVGLHLTRLGADVVADLDQIEMPAGTSLANPIDAPAPAIAYQGGRAAERIMRAVLGADVPPAVVLVHLNVGVISSHNDSDGSDAVTAILEAIARARDTSARRTHILLALRDDGREQTTRKLVGHRETARRLRFTVYDDILPAARGAAALIHDDAADQHTTDSTEGDIR